MSRHTCTACHTSIPAGMAVSRSVNFTRVFWHTNCYEARHGLLPARRAHLERIAQVAS